MKNGMSLIFVSAHSSNAVYTIKHKISH
jgi:hypothetical protein